MTCRGRNEGCDFAQEGCQQEGCRPEGCRRALENAQRQLNTLKHQICQVEDTIEKLQRDLDAAKHECREDSEEECMKQCCHMCCRKCNCRN